ncbi:hypothetical protein QVD17_32960 [Tagetes erecta]|uniref:Cystatin domain-containing protein n=1 Tax=Tagetes erecta TaxID=13708 RepID=A0AAD8NL18_TARER|nr:hypothetical protein QVD17_32960 [Tagetes erecta]
MANHSITMTFTFVTLFVIISSCVTNGGMLGGRTKVADVKTNKEMQEMGKYSVEEYNRLRRSEPGNDEGDLVFSEVVEAEQQVVAGMKYYLKLETFTKSGEAKVFQAVVEVKPWLRKKQLLRFAPSPVVLLPVR